MNPTQRRQARKVIFNRDNHTCLFCGSKEDLTIEHVHPSWTKMYTKGQRKNMITCCLKCNQEKSGMMPLEYLFKGYIDEYSFKMLRSPGLRKLAYNWNAIGEW